MFLVFSTDPATFDYGFHATYESADCGGYLTDSSGLSYMIDGLRLFYFFLQLSWITNIVSS